MFEHLDLQPSLWQGEGPPPLIAELTFVVINGATSYGAEIRQLPSLEVRAMSSHLCRGQDIDPTKFYAACSALLEAVEELRSPFPL